MALKECDKCSEMVDEAKAFCPGCGHAFVEEQTRQEASNFDAAESTVQLGQTMYNQMLSDMGLNTSKAPNPPEKKVEVIVPLTPLAPASKPAARAAEKPGPASYRKWIILAIVLVVLLFLVIFLLGLAGAIFYYRSGSF